MKLFPDFANSYDSLSEAYLLSGNPEMAIQYSLRRLEKLPADSTINDNFRNNLRQISEDRLEELGADSGKLNI